MVEKRISRVFLIISSIALIQVISTIILARSFSKTDMGLYRLVLTIGEFVAIFAILGLNGSFVRFFSRQSPDAYDWKRYSIIAITGCGLLSSLVIIGAGIFYSLETIFILIAILIAIAALANMLFTSLLRAKRRYELAIFLARLNFLMFFLFLIILIILQKVSLKSSLALFSFSALITAVLIFMITFKKTPSGKKLIPPSVFKEGFIFLGLTLASITILRADQLFIGKMLS